MTNFIWRVLIRLVLMIFGYVIAQYGLMMEGFFILLSLLGIFLLAGSFLDLCRILEEKKKNAGTTLHILVMIVLLIIIAVLMFLGYNKSLFIKIAADALLIFLISGGAIGIILLIIIMFISEKELGESNGRK